MLLFHGTTLENAMRIQKEGFTHDKKVWDCSNDETYFFTEEYFRSEFDLDEDSDLWEYAINETMDQARLSLSLENPVDYRPAVLVFDTDLMENGSDIEPDYSCEGMDGMAVALTNPDMKGLVAVVIANECERETRLFVLTGIIEREHFCKPELSQINELIVESLKNVEYYSVLEELSCSLEYTTTWIGRNYLTSNQDHSEEEILKEVA